MKRLMVTRLVIGLLVGGASIQAAEGPKTAAEMGHPHHAAIGIHGLERVALSSDQEAKLEALRDEYGPKMGEIGKKMHAVLTPEQIKARQDAENEARTSGKSPNEIRDAIRAAVKLQDDQKRKLAELRTEIEPLHKALRAKILEILTPEQKAQLEAAHANEHAKARANGNP